MEPFFALLQDNGLNRRRGTTGQQLRIAIISWIERTYQPPATARSARPVDPIEYAISALEGELEPTPIPLRFAPGARLWPLSPQEYAALVAAVPEGPEPRLNVELLAGNRVQVCRCPLPPSSAELRILPQGLGFSAGQRSGRGRGPVSAESAT